MQVHLQVAEWQSTPTVTSISPRAASPGKMITVTGQKCVADFAEAVGGERLEQGLKRFERVSIGH